jgi:hypothetical protein
MVRVEVAARGRQQGWKQRNGTLAAGPPDVVCAAPKPISDCASTGNSTHSPHHMHMLQTDTTEEHADQATAQLAASSTEDQASCTAHIAAACNMPVSMCRHFPVAPLHPALSQAPHLPGRRPAGRGGRGPESRKERICLRYPWGRISCRGPCASPPPAPASSNKCIQQLLPSCCRIAVTRTECHLQHAHANANVPAIVQPEGNLKTSSRWRRCCADARCSDVMMVHSQQPTSDNSSDA